MFKSLQKISRTMSRPATRAPQMVRATPRVAVRAFSAAAKRPASSMNMRACNAPAMRPNLARKNNLARPAQKPLAQGKRQFSLIKLAATLGVMYYGGRFVRDTFRTGVMSQHYSAAYDESVKQINANSEKIQKILGRGVDITPASKTRFSTGWGPSRVVTTGQWSFPAGDAGEIVCLAIEPPTGQITLADVSVLKYPPREEWGISGQAKKALSAGKYTAAEFETLNSLQRWIAKSYSHGLSGEAAAVALNSEANNFYENPIKPCELTSIYHADVPIQKSLVVPESEDTTLNVI